MTNNRPADIQKSLKGMDRALFVMAIGLILIIVGTVGKLLS